MTDTALPPGKPVQEVPVGNLAGFKKYWSRDIASGFLVFLIALPLCLAIAQASGCPPIAGIFTAVVGGLLAPLFSNSELTIKGPAAGLIVIVLGAVTDFGYTDFDRNKELGIKTAQIEAQFADPAARATELEKVAQDLDKQVAAVQTKNFQAYRLMIAIGVAAGIVQICFGLLRSGAIGEFFPLSAVHGLLASIGVMIVAKQLHVVFGNKADGQSPLGWIQQIPNSISDLNPEIAVIGLVSILIMFGWAYIPVKRIRRIPPQLVAVVVAIVLGSYFDLSHEHTYTFYGHQYPVSEKYLVAVPLNMFGAITFPDFSGLWSMTGLKWVVMFALIGSLESMLSAKAIDLVDPYRRKTDLNRDLLGVGIANTFAACLGGLPMISEIVRSRANLDNGAKTRFANMFHGLFLLAFVAMLPTLIHRIPNAALAAMLVYTGCRLASYKEFLHAFKVGPDHGIVFVGTIVGVLATDLLIGILIGVAIKIFMHVVVHRMPISYLFRPAIEVEYPETDRCHITVRRAAIFTTWMALRKKILDEAAKIVVLDLQDTVLVDSTVMEKLHELEMEFAAQGRLLKIVGLEQHEGFASHAHSAQRKTTIVGKLPV